MIRILFVCHGRICLESKNNLDKILFCDRILFTNDLPIFFGVPNLLIEGINIGDTWQK